MRVPDNAKLGTAELLAYAANPRALRLDTGSILFTDDTRPVAHLWRTGAGPGVTPSVVDEDLAGRSFETLAALSPYAFTAAVDPGDAGAHVRRTSTDGGGPTCFSYTAPQPTFFPSINADSTSVYFADNASGHILRTGKGCDEVPTIFAADQHAVAMTPDNLRLYWVTADGHVRSRDKAMLGAITTYDAGLVAPGGIADRNGTIYVTDEAAGIVYELPPSSDPIVVATGQAGPHGIVVNMEKAKTIYWSNRTSGEIVSATR